MTGVMEVSTNQGIIAGRDVYLGDQYVVQDTLYFEPSLKEVEPPEYPSPPKAGELVQLLMQRRLLVLAGPQLEEKGRIARHVAWLLREELKSTSPTLRVREWYRSSDPQKVETAFHEHEETLLLLPQIQPHHLGHRLGELVEFLRTHSHYAIITTDSSPGAWRIGDLTSHDLAWCDLSWDTYYGLDLMLHLLIERLAVLNDLLPEGLLPRGPQPDGLLVEQMTLVEVAATLKSPEKIDPFLRWLMEQEPPLGRQIIKIQLDLLSGDQRIVEKWYERLDRQDQMLAIGLLFFDGLPDDQAFAGLEGLVSLAWRASDPFLGHFDYDDLERLAAFFSLVDAGDDGSRIEMSSQQRRRDLLQTVWKLQRRRVLSALPALTALIRRSASRETRIAIEVKQDKKNDNREELQGESRFQKPEKSELREQELYSSGRRVRRFRDAMIETLAEIGLLSLEAVEPFLLDLAVQGSPPVRKIVAKTLASWRASDQNDALFKLLHQWWQEGCETDFSRAWISDLAKQGVDAFSEIRATVAQAVGYAVQYDPPNQLTPRLGSLVGVLIRDYFPKVRTQVLEVTVPLAVARHLEQIEPLLRTVEMEEDLMHSAAFGMAMAVSLRPQETWAFLGSKLSDWQNEPPQPPPAVSERERWIATLALAYGYIQLDVDEVIITPRQVLARLQAILGEEDHPFIRRHVLLGMGLQAIRNFGLVAPMLDQLVSTVTLADRAFLVSIFRQAYLRQREEMKGGDGQIEIDDRVYSVWIHSERPLTPLESLLFEWIEDGDAVARQIAVQAFAALEGSELERSERSLIQNARNAPAVNRWGRPIWKERRARRLNPLGYMSVFLASPRNVRQRLALQPLMAELVEMTRRRERTVGYIDLQPRESVEQFRRRSIFSFRAPSPREIGPSVLPSSFALLRRWAKPAGREGGREAGRIISGLRKTLVIHRLRWPIVAAALYILVQARSLGADVATNYAYWLCDLPYHSKVEHWWEGLVCWAADVEPIEAYPFAPEGIDYSGGNMQVYMQMRAEWLKSFGGGDER